MDNDLRQYLEHMEARLNDRSDRMEARLMKYVDERIEQTEARLNERIEELETHLKKYVDERIEELETRLKKYVDERIEQVEIRLGQKLERGIEATANDIGQLHTAIQKLEQRMTDRIEIIDKRLRRSDSNVTTTLELLTRQSRWQGETDIAMGESAARLMKLEQDMADVKRKLNLQ